MTTEPNSLTQSFRILQVEDEPNDAYLVQWALAKNQFNVVWQHVLDGDQALTFLEEASPLPDLILLDLNMPRMSGLECLSRLQAHPIWRDIPTIVLSTSYAQSDQDAAHNLGASDYFSKPMDIMALVCVMRTLGERWIAPRQMSNKESP